MSTPSAWTKFTHAGRAVSLRAKLIALFAAILVVTTGVSAFVGARFAERAVENEIRERALETDRTLALELASNSTFNSTAATQRLAALLRTHQGLTSDELAVERSGSDLVIHVTLGPNGSEVETREGTAEVVRAVWANPAKPETLTRLDERADGRFWVVTVPLKVGHSHAGLTLEASLAEADRLAATESQVFAGAAIAGALVLILAAQILIGRLIGRPIGKLANAMAEVESGRLDAAAPLGSGDEFDRLASGFNTMLSRIRGFNQELEGRIEQATSDLARKNRDLAEVNDQLVAARRDANAKERLAALGQLAGTIAHELGNPLNSISGHVQLLERHAGLPDDVRADLGLVKSEIERMTGVIRRFLDSTRGLRPAPEPVNLASLIDESIALSLSAEARSKIQVSRSVEPEVAGVLTDPGLVRHVIVNLLANAVDAMPQGGNLLVFAREGGGELCVGVSDTGGGVSPEERRRIFEPFYTTKPRGKGTGLGLAICREIARALKGRIDVESALGRGSTFTLSIPLVREAERGAPVQGKRETA